MFTVLVPVEFTQSSYLSASVAAAAPASRSYLLRGSKEVKLCMLSGCWVPNTYRGTSNTYRGAQLSAERWRDNALDVKQAELFDAQGFLVLNDGEVPVLSPAETVALHTHATDRCNNDDEIGASAAAFLFCAGAEPPPPPVIGRLLANEAVLPSVLGLLRSHNVTCHQARVHRLPSPPSSASAVQLEQELSGGLDRDMECRPAPRITVTAIVSALCLDR